MKLRRYGNLIKFVNIFITAIYYYTIVRSRLSEHRELHVCKVQTFLYLPEKKQEKYSTIGTKKKKNEQKTFW